MVELSILIPAHNEEESLPETIKKFSEYISREQIVYEILVVNDHSTDRTESLLTDLHTTVHNLRYVNNYFPRGFGYAVRCGLENFSGECVAIVMADGSDLPEDLVAYYRKLLEGPYDAVFGSRFIKGGMAVDYPPLKLFINRLANLFIRILFGLKYNDITNAFKLYRKETINGLKPFMSNHFDLTVELPLKVIVRNYSYSWVPNTWVNRDKGASKLKLKEMGGRYLLVILNLFIEKYFSVFLSSK